MPPNVMAALALCEAVGVAPERLLVPLKNFKGSPHRVETVAEIGGVLYVDDSKRHRCRRDAGGDRRRGQRAWPSCSGGDGKDRFRRSSRRWKGVAGRLPSDWPRSSGNWHGARRQWYSDAHRGRHASAVQWLAAQAPAGDCVLLSPACASLDVYRDYAHRAQAFIDAV